MELSGCLLLVRLAMSALTSRRKSVKFLKGMVSVTFQVMLAKICEGESNYWITGQTAARRVKLAWVSSIESWSLAKSALTSATLFSNRGQRATTRWETRKRTDLPSDLGVEGEILGANDLDVGSLKANSSDLRDEYEGRGEGGDLGGVEALDDEALLAIDLEGVVAEGNAFDSLVGGERQLDW